MGPSEEWILEVGSGRTSLNEEHHGALLCPTEKLVHVWGKRTDINGKIGHCRSQQEVRQTLGFSRIFTKEQKLGCKKYKWWPWAGEWGPGFNQGDRMLLGGGAHSA